MNFLSKLTAMNPRSLFILDPRYINLDGSVYGTKGMGRYLSMPVLQANAVICTLDAAAFALLEPVAKRQAAFTTYGLVDVVFAGIAAWRGSSWFYKNLPVDKESVIDKKGRLHSDPAASIKMADHYKSEAISSTAAIIIMFGVSCAIRRPLNVCPLFFVPLVAWQFRAASKLSRGTWTIRTKPPQLEKKELPVIAPIAIAANSNFLKLG